MCECGGSGLGLFLAANQMGNEIKRIVCVALDEGEHSHRHLAHSLCTHKNGHTPLFPLSLGLESKPLSLLG